ncbi:hypothetical protein EYF80_037408 [Liparis tanakae]|uniref:Uncharacterized protein n=1 Tax=Liparis tanakae TaxID=230148 RepID=A0A4Z2GGX9_9TELE|nr:hypothetical protein EYF80_037408 [Liparis tanakae]
MLLNLKHLQTQQLTEERGHWKPAESKTELRGEQQQEGDNEGTFTWIRGPLTTIEPTAEDDDNDKKQQHYILLEQQLVSCPTHSPPSVSSVMRTGQDRGR